MKDEEAAVGGTLNKQHTEVHQEISDIGEHDDQLTIGNRAFKPRMLRVTWRYIDGDWRPEVVVRGPYAKRMPGEYYQAYEGHRRFPGGLPSWVIAVINKHKPTGVPQ